MAVKSQITSEVLRRPGEECLLGLGKKRKKREEVDLPLAKVLAVLSSHVFNP